MLLSKNAIVWMLTLSMVCAVGVARAGETIRGELLDPASYGPSFVEPARAPAERATGEVRKDPKLRNGANGVWQVPSRGACTAAASGEFYAANKWGDTRMGIGFPQVVDVHGAFFAGQGGSGAWTTGIRVRGYRDGKVVQETDWMHDIGASPHWFAMDLRGVDRIEIVSIPVVNGGGWYAMDDLTFTPVFDSEAGVARTVTVDFDDLQYKYKLTGSNYAGLTWEVGRGEFTDSEEVHGPMVPPGHERDVTGGGGLRSPASGTDAELPTLVRGFQSVRRGDAESRSYPPDSDGAIGPDHYVTVVNRVLAIYDRATGELIDEIPLNEIPGGGSGFLPGSNGDPRILFDHLSGRWIVLVSDFTADIYIAVSSTSDPTDTWFKSSFLTAQGSDAGRWPDYETLGVDAHAIYTGAYMVGGGMTLFAIDKDPLIAAEPELGAVYAFRGLPWEGAIQPSYTYDDSEPAYHVSLYSADRLRLRQVNTLGLEWSLVELGTVDVEPFDNPPNAPALGSTTPLNTVDDRLMMSVYRDGSLWTAHTIRHNGRAAARWYEIDVDAMEVVQWGTVADDSLHYFFPSIMVNSAGDVAMGFTGSDSSQYAACYYTGRRADDPPGEMAPPVMYKEGIGPQNNIDSWGRNRWGDYSYTTLDPVDDLTFWTIQEYGDEEDIWGCYVAVLTYGFADCNENGIADPCDIDCGPAGGPCDVEGCGESDDCNENDVPDDCEPDADCNTNGIQDICDTYSGASEDCNADDIPDECQTDLDCNGNGQIDECEELPDCNHNGNPDTCDLLWGSSYDCDGSGIPDECENYGIIMQADFESGTPTGWDMTGLWHTTTDCGQAWPCDPVQWAYFGEDEDAEGAPKCDYDTGSREVGDMIARTVTIAGNGTDAQLTYCSFYEGEGGDSGESGFDWAWVTVNGAEVDDVSLNGTLGVWETRTVDMRPYLGQQVTIGFHFDSRDRLTNDTLGWQVDLVQLEGPLPIIDCNDNGIPDHCEELELGDPNADGVVDLADHGYFTECLSGPDALPRPRDPNCVEFCLDVFDFGRDGGDGDVDAFDYGEFQNAFHIPGPEAPPGD